MKGNKNESNGEETKQGKVNSFTRIPKLPNFNPEHDELPAYISRFELTASQNRWNEEEKFIRLSNLLTGECLQVLHSLQDKTYVALKDALFKRYKYTEEGFHDRFRRTCPKEGEDFSNYVNRLVIGRDRWFESAGVKKDDYKGLADLVLKEQMYESCSAELVTFLKKRNPKTTNGVVGLAEQFQTAYPNAKLSKKPSLCAMSTKFQERQSRTMDRVQDRTRYASAPNYFGRKQYSNIRQPFRPRPNVSQSNFNYRPRTPNQYGNVRSQFQPNFYKPRQQDSRTLNQVKQQFDPRNSNKKAHLSSSLSGDKSNIPLFKGLINNYRMFSHERHRLFYVSSFCY